MDTSILTTKPGSETVATKQGKTVGDSHAVGKVDSREQKPTNPGAPKAPVAKSDRKAAPRIKDITVTVKDTEPTAQGKFVLRPPSQA
ncbi:MAG: hypothetical protein ACREBU_20180 [Nitrososphaera sp.]